MGRDNAGFQMAVGQESVHYATSGRDGAVFLSSVFCRTLHKLLTYLPKVTGDYLPILYKFVRYGCHRY